MQELIKQIKEDEGFDGNNYLDSLDIPTIGYGTRLPLTKLESELILKSRLGAMIDELLSKKPIIMTLSQDRQLVLFNMTYQMGVRGILKFKKMFLAIENNDFAEASLQMLESKWHIQTPNRAERLAKIMGGIYV